MFKSKEEKEKLRKERELVCIRISRTWGGYELKPEFKKRTYADYLLIRDSIKKDPYQFELNEQVEQKHMIPPTLEFSEGDYGYAPDEVMKGRKVPVVAEMHFTYDTPFHMQRKSHFGKIIFALLMVIAGVIAVNLYAGYMSAQVTLSAASCRVYTEYGVPTFMTIDESRYDLKSNGDVVDDQAIFVNPWHADIVANKDECQVIRVK